MKVAADIFFSFWASLTFQRAIFFCFEPRLLFSEATFFPFWASLTFQRVIFFRFGPRLLFSEPFFSVLGLAYFSASHFFSFWASLTFQRAIFFCFEPRLLFSEPFFPVLGLAYFSARPRWDLPKVTPSSSCSKHKQVFAEGVGAEAYQHKACNNCGSFFGNGDAAATQPPAHEGDHEGHHSNNG